MPSIEKYRIERAARIYASNDAAGSALGIAPGSFGRLCHRYGIETPQAPQAPSAHRVETKCLWDESRPYKLRPVSVKEK